MNTNNLGHHVHLHHTVTIDGVFVQFDLCAGEVVLQRWTLYPRLPSRATRRTRQDHAVDVAAHNPGATWLTWASTRNLFSRSRKDWAGKRNCLLLRGKTRMTLQWRKPPLKAQCCGAKSATGWAGLMPRLAVTRMVTPAPSAAVTTILCASIRLRKPNNGSANGDPGEAQTASNSRI